MRILIYSGERTGSYSLCKWIAKEFDLTFLTELEEWNPSIDNVVVKRTVSFRDNLSYFDINKNSIYFDKIIRLYRNDIQQQAESRIYAESIDIWHHSNDETLLDAYYEIPYDFLKENQQNIIKHKTQLYNDRKYLLSLEIGTAISYEELFESEEGQYTLERYLNIQGKTKLFNPKLKLRKETPKHII